MATTREELAAAMEHHQAGRLQQAEGIYRQILQTEPEHAEALYFLGVIGHQAGDNQTALDYLSRSIASKSNAAASHCMIATVYLAVGRTEEAVASCRQALLLRPDYAQAHHNLGIALQTQGNLGEAVSCYRQALILEPDSPETLNNLGGAFQAVDQLDEAATHYRKALLLKPEYAEAHSNLGNTLTKQGKYDEAVACYRRALQIRPDFAEVHNNLGMTLQDQGDLDAAVASFQQAVQLRPDYAEAYNHLGHALTERGNLNEAVAAFHQALQHRANYAEALNNLATALQAQGRLDEAEKSLNMALRARPDFAEAHSNLGAVLQGLKQHDEALACFRRALEIKPDFVEVLNNLGLALEDQRNFEEAAETCRKLIELQPRQPLWELRLATLSCPDVLKRVEEADEYRARLEADLRRLSAVEMPIPPAKLAVLGGTPPLQLMYQGRDDRPIKEAFANTVRRSLPKPRPGVPTEKPRIGFVVTQGREIIFLQFIRGILEHLDGDLFDVAVLCAPSGVAVIRTRIANPAVSILPLPARIDRSAEAIRAVGFDLLYYWEVGSDTTNYFLPFFRPAAVQCTSWGIPVTSGIAEIDYYLSSELLETEDAAAHYTEELVKLTTLPIYYYRPELPAEPKGREHFGLASDRNLYCCPQSLLKFHPDFDRLLAGILQRDPTGELVLIAGHARAKEALTERFSAAMPDCIDRIRFFPWQARGDFFSLTSACDVMLDTLYFGGGNTTYEALGLGLPVVTLPSAYMRGRVAAACYRKMGVTDCVASDPAGYVDVAVRLATDRDYRETVRSQIAASSDVLFEDLGAVGELQEFFQQAIQSRRNNS